MFELNFKKEEALEIILQTYVCYQSLPIFFTKSVHADLYTAFDLCES